MENTSLHTQKVTILSRLVKDNQLTLEEALLLLKPEEEETPVRVAPVWSPGTTTPYIQPYTGGETSITFGTSSPTILAGFNVSSPNTTLSGSSGNSTFTTTTADLNN